MAAIHKVTAAPVSPSSGDIYIIKKDTGVEIQVAGSGASPVVALPKEEVTVSGPSTQYYGQNGTHIITNYSDATVYTLSSSDGTVSRNKETITFSCNNIGLSVATFTVNGKVVSVNLVALKPKAPSITAPLNGSTGVSPTNVQLTTSVLEMNFPGAPLDTHLSTDWEVSTDPNFTTLVFSSYNNTTNKTSITIP